MHDRFTGQERLLGPHNIGPFVDLCIVNDFDVVEQNPRLLVRHGDYFRGLIARWAPATEFQRLIGSRQ